MACNIYIKCEFTTYLSRPALVLLRGLLAFFMDSSKHVNLFYVFKFSFEGRTVLRISSSESMLRRWDSKF